MPKTQKKPAKRPIKRAGKAESTPMEEKRGTEVRQEAGNGQGVVSREGVECKRPGGVQPKTHAGKTRVATKARRDKILKGLLEGKTAKQAGIPIWGESWISAGTLTAGL